MQKAQLTPSHVSLMRRASALESCDLRQSNSGALSRRVREGLSERLLETRGDNLVPFCTQQRDECGKEIRDLGRACFSPKFAGRVHQFRAAFLPPCQCDMPRARLANPYPEEHAQLATPSQSTGLLARL